MTAQFYVQLHAGLDLRVTVPPEIERQVASSFMVELRNEIDRAQLRYAPTHRGFLLELRDRVFTGIEPNRLGRGGVHSFVDRVAYRLWDERRRDVSQARFLVAEDQVTRPPQTGEMPAIRPDTPRPEGGL